MEETHYKIIEVGSVCLTFLSIIFGLERIKSAHPLCYKLIILFLIVSGIAGMTSIVLVRVYSASSFLLFHIYTLLEFILLSLLYRSVLRSDIFRKATVLGIVAFTIFKFLDVLAITGINKVDTLAMTIESVVMILFSILYFGQMIQKREGQIIMFPMFWINTAILFYFSGCFFLFLFSAYISKSIEHYQAYWSIHNTFVVIRDVLFTVAMIMLGKANSNQTSTTNKQLVDYG